MLQRISSVPDAQAPPQGRWIGMLSATRGGLARLKAQLRILQAREDFDSLDMPALLNELIDGAAAIEVLYVHGHWRGVNDLDDLHRAVDFAHAQSQFGSEPGAAPPPPGHD